MKNPKLSRIANYIKHIAFCFETTPRGSYFRTLQVAGAYLGLHLGLFKAKNRVVQAHFNDFDMDLNIYSREVAGYWEIFQERQYLELQPRKDRKVVVLDIGANVGFFAMKQALQHKANLRLIAFEPDPATFARLQANIDRVKGRLAANVSCYNCAIDTRVGEAKFLRDMSVESHILEEGSEAPSITVQVTTLDAVVEREGIEKIDLMKIDVEGHELKVLAGGQHALAITENITLEYHEPHFVEEITNILAPLRFHLVSHDPEKAIMSFSRVAANADEALVASPHDEPRAAMA